MPDLFCRTALEGVDIDTTIEEKRLDDEYFEGVEEDWDNEVEGLAIQIIELFLTILNKPDIQSLILCGLYPLTNTIVNLLMITKAQVKCESLIKKYKKNYLGKKMGFRTESIHFRR